ncbi:MAG: hypothetical protein EHM20_08090 [Alphaproteobacteria bacterium]|nr:MAG: hypothetical protein EHM20_08090 [Alphaproteobacteria bacterium]
MTLPKISSYEVRTSRTEQKIPVVNGVHLHSIYNPFKEAETLVEAHTEALKNKNEVLVLGLGFAYHVNAIIEKLTQFHGDDFKVIVIEPNVQVYDDCIAFNLLNKKNVLVYTGFKSKELYCDIDLIHFLLGKPAMIAHPASYNLYQYYFKTILTYEAPRSLGSIKDFVSSPEVKKYLDGFNPESTLDNVLFKEVPNKAHFEQTDFLAMALAEMTKKSHEMNLEKKLDSGDN